MKLDEDMLDAIAEAAVAAVTKAVNLDVRLSTLENKRVYERIAALEAKVAILEARAAQG